MNLEFEIEVKHIFEENMIYIIKRKGLEVGKLILHKPYNNEKILKKKMVLE